MKISLARSAGFCFGVRRALQLADQAIEKQTPICSLGELIHNPSVVEGLRLRGVDVINDLSEAGGRTVLIRSHGVAPEILKVAEEQGIKIIDATCPFVRRVQKLAEDMTDQGYQVVVIGSAEHPEVRAILGWTGYKAVVVYELKDLGQVPSSKKIGILSQTTQTRDRFYTIARELIGKAQEVRCYDTICKASLDRQEEAAAMAENVGTMIVIGGRNSANTCKLTEICAAYVPTHHIENVTELDAAWFGGIDSVGVTAGASTPDWIIEEVVRGMTMFDEELEATQGELQDASPEVVPEVVPVVSLEAAPEMAPSNDAEAAAGTAGDESEQALAKTPSEPGQEEMMNLDFAGTPRQIQQGDLISGTVVQVRDDEVLIDIGGKSEGIIPRQELALKSVDNPNEVVKEGDVIDVYVLRVDNDEGHLMLSKKRADRAKALQEVEQALDTKVEMAGEVLKVVKGGLLIDVMGMRGFVPASLVERGYVGDLDKYVGKILRLRVIEFDKNRGKVVLSQKAILQEEYILAQKELWETIQAGEIRKGTVRHLTNFGAFVDLGGVDGLLHISELSWGRIKHPSEVVQEGDEVEVYVISIDRDSKRISLSLKQAQANPWKTVDERYQVGEIVKGTIVRLVSFGVFVEVEPGVEGLVHISRLADYRVAKPEDVVSAGQEVDVKILEINKQDQRISLSIKDTIKADKESKGRGSDRESRADREPVAGNDPEVSQNLGDLFGDLFTHSEQ